MKNYLGFWKEYSYRKNRIAKTPSILSLSLFEKKQKYDEKVLNYFEDGILVMQAGFTEYCVISEEKIATSKQIYTDGDWIWTSEFIYYYKQYGIDIPVKFKKKIYLSSFIDKVGIADKDLKTIKENIWSFIADFA